MDAVSTPHPTDQTLSSFGLGKLDDAAIEAVSQHLEECSECRTKVSSLSADSFLGRVRDAQGAMHSTFGHSILNAAQNKKASKPAPAADSLPPGLAEHPDYDVLKELGRGGMGVVYLVHNKLMGRDEVLKVMSRQIMERPGVLDRFLREIRAVAKLRHPNIVTAYHAFRLEENLVFAMEHVPGLDLSKVVKAKGTLPVAHACNFIYQAALGLQNAFESGLIHRDIKPHNLMLSHNRDRSLVKILDFGLAKATREEKVDSALTSVGQALGTPDFIAPEQILDAQSADIRADIYSLGGTLFYLLTGRPPFKANSLYDLYQAHISRDIDPLNLIRPEVPSELAALVAKMMAKDTKRRFQTPDEVARALTPFFKKGSATANPRALAPTEVAPPHKPIAPPASPAPVARVEPEWPSLIDVKEPEAPATLAALEPDAERERPRRRFPIAVALSLFSLACALMLMTLTLKWRGGTVTVEGLPEGATVTIEDKVRKPDGEGANATLKLAHGPNHITVDLGGERLYDATVTVDWGAVKPTVITINRPALATASSPAATPKDAVASGVDKWVSLFNGKDTKGWFSIDDKGADAREHWQVGNGVLVGTGPHSHLYSSRDDYGDIRVRAEVRMKTGGNSGLYVRAKKGLLFPDGYEAEFQNPNGTVKAGALCYSTLAPQIEGTPGPVSANNWFNVEIQAIGNHVKVIVNDKPCAEYTDPDRTRTRGYIALQAYGAGTRVEFRKLEVMELKPATVVREGKPSGPPSGLIAFYDFNDGKAQDLSGHGHHGVFSANPPLRTQGTEGDGLSFSSSQHNYITFPLDINAEVLPQITMGGWFRITQPNRSQNLISHDDGWFDRTLCIDNRGRTDGKNRWSATTGQKIVAVADVEADRWTFVAFRHDQNTANLTIDVNDARVTHKALYTPGSQKTFIGRSPFSGDGGDLDGRVDSVFFYNRMLDDKEIDDIRARGSAAILSEKPAATAKATPPLSTPIDAETGFVPLFNGKDLRGWKPDRGDPAQWRIENGQIVAYGKGDPKQQSFLLSDLSLTDFQLRFEFYLLQRRRQRLRLPGGGRRDSFAPGDQPPQHRRRLRLNGVAPRLHPERGRWLSPSCPPGGAAQRAELGRDGSRSAWPARPRLGERTVGANRRPEQVREEPRCHSPVSIAAPAASASSAIPGSSGFETSGSRN